MKTSQFFNLNLHDLAKGFIMAVLASVAAIVKTTIESGSIHFDWPTMGKYALIAGLSYLLKNLFTNSKDDFAAKEPK